MEAQREAVEVGEHVVGEPPSGLLPNIFEHRIAQVVEEHAGKARTGISDNQRDREAGGGLQPRRHPVDRALVGKGHDERHRLGKRHQHHGDGDAAAQRGRICRPEIGQEAPEGRPHRRQRRGYRGFGRHCTLFRQFSAAFQCPDGRRAKRALRRGAIFPPLTLPPG